MSIGQRICKGENITFKQTKVTASVRGFLAWSLGFCLSLLLFYSFHFFSRPHGAALSLCFPRISCKKGPLFFMFSCHFLWQALLSLLCCCFCLVFLWALSVSWPSPVPRNSAAITIDKPQVCIPYFSVLYFSLLFYTSFQFLRLFQWSVFCCLSPAGFLYVSTGLAVLSGCSGQQSPVISCLEFSGLWCGWTCLVSLHHHLGFPLQQWRCGSKYFREKGVTDFTPQESYAMEIQFSKSLLGFFFKGTYGKCRGHYLK